MNHSEDRPEPVAQSGVWKQEDGSYGRERRRERVESEDANSFARSSGMHKEEWERTPGANRR